MKKVAFITGGTSGLGLCVVKKLVQLDYDVVSDSRDKKKIREAQEQLNSDKVFFIQGDIADEQTIENVYQHLFNEYGFVNVVINNVGIIEGGGIEDISPEAWK